MVRGSRLRPRAPHHEGVDRLHERTAGLAKGVPPTKAWIIGGEHHLFILRCSGEAGPRRTAAPNPARPTSRRAARPAGRRAGLSRRRRCLRVRPSRCRRRRCRGAIRRAAPLSRPPRGGRAGGLCAAPNGARAAKRFSASARTASRVGDLNRQRTKEPARRPRPRCGRAGHGALSAPIFPNRPRGSRPGAPRSAG